MTTTPPSEPAIARTWHLVTCEFPPQVGGVSDYSLALASALMDTGDPIHVWSSSTAAAAPPVHGITLHRSLGRFRPRDLWQTGRALDQIRGRRILLLQWVPHGYGCRAINLPFALWTAWRRWWHRDELHVMVHEPFIEWGWKPTRLVVAFVQRMMLATLCAAADRVWVSTPYWTTIIRRFVPRSIPMQWLPVAMAIPGWAQDAPRTGSGNHPTAVVGHLGTFSPLIEPLLDAALDVVLERSSATLRLIGRDSDRYRARFLQTRPAASHRVLATGAVDGDLLVRQLLSCDLMVQPYPDGVSARRTSTLLAMRLGVPVVTNRGHITEEFWAEHQAVALAGDVSGAAVGRCAVHLLDDEAARHALGRAARDLYDRVFDIRHTVAALAAASTRRIGATVQRASRA